MVGKSINANILILTILLDFVKLGNLFNITFNLVKAAREFVNNFKM